MSTPGTPLHWNPGRQEGHWESPVALEAVPGGQGVGDEELYGQNAPEGHVKYEPWVQYPPSGQYPQVAALTRCDSVQYRVPSDPTATPIGEASLVYRLPMPFMVTGNPVPSRVVVAPVGETLLNLLFRVSPTTRFPIVSSTARPPMLFPNSTAVGTLESKNPDTPAEPARVITIPPATLRMQ